MSPAEQQSPVWGHSLCSCFAVAGHTFFWMGCHHHPKPTLPRDQCSGPCPPARLCLPPPSLQHPLCGLVRRCSLPLVSCSLLPPAPRAPPGPLLLLPLTSNISCLSSLSKLFPAALGSWERPDPAFTQPVAAPTPVSQPWEPASTPIPTSQPWEPTATPILVSQTWCPISPSTTSVSPRGHGTHGNDAQAWISHLPSQSSHHWLSPGPPGPHCAEDGAIWGHG